MSAAIAYAPPRHPKNLRPKTLVLIEEAFKVLHEAHPMTLRQCYYQLVSKQVIENNRSSYRRLGDALVSARQQNIIPWEWLEDRLRKPRHVSMWHTIAAFAESASQWFRFDVWDTQPEYVEVWLEKDALSGIFEDELEEYGVTLNVGRGFDGWSSIREAALRYGESKPATVLYFGDFDPSGEKMTTSLLNRLLWFGFSYPKVVRVAILKEDIARYNLPPDFAKLTDSRAKSFIQRYGNEAVELDALPATVLRERLVASVEELMDLDRLSEVRVRDKEACKRIDKALRRIK
jgi:hypothetical protein